jgi:hypothetical protein
LYKNGERRKQKSREKERTLQRRGYKERKKEKRELR